MKALLALALFGYLLQPQLQARAETLTGIVAGIEDGDSLRLTVARRPIPIRLVGIDAPERNQPFGEQARGNLGRLAFNREVRAECAAPDRGGQRPCRVWVQPDACRNCAPTLDLGLAQLGDGMAWWNREDANALPRQEREAYQSAEFTARLRRLGLWAGSKPIPPWNWRTFHH